MAGEDVVKQARELLANSSRIHALNDKDPQLDREVGWMIEVMADEIERLRGVDGELDDIRECSKCDLCEDHHE